MNWTEMLNQQVEDAYRATEGLIDLVDGAALDWKPQDENNWMTTGQLLKHLESSCGWVMKGFVTGDWTFPDGGSPDEGSMDVQGHQMPTTESVEATKAELAKDKALSLSMIAEAGEEDLANKMAEAPWNPQPRVLGFQMTECIAHLQSHKSQLFYYLKLQGTPVNTMTLWGLEGGPDPVA